MSATVIHMPRTAAGRKLFRECAFAFMPGYRWPNGVPVEEGEFDKQAAWDEAYDARTKAASGDIVPMSREELMREPPPRRGDR